MSSTLELKRPNRIPLGIREGLIPKAVLFRPGRPAALDYGAGEPGVAECLRCPDQPCMSYRSDEVGVLPLAAFPSDPTGEVCPTGALTWPDNRHAPVVESSRCISCGICATRCPIGAIYLDDEGIAAVESTSVRSPNDVVERTHEATRTLLAAATRSGSLRVINDDTVIKAHRRVNDVKSLLPAKFPTLFVRNLLRTLGVKAEARRLGDVNVRMDLIFSTDGQTVGTCEVEFAASTLLDTPRNVLDNLAVLVARYGIARTTARAMIVGLSLPNERSEFWQVLADIRKVLSVEVAVATTTALTMLVWNQTRVTSEGMAALSLIQDQRSIRTGFEAVLGRKIKLTSGAGGVLESTK